MSGTWLQEGYYGSGLSISPGLSGKETDDELISFAKRQPAIATARKLCKHSWVVITAIFRSQPHSILAPRVHEPLDPACWLAFVDAPSKHDTPGWSQVPLVLFDEWERMPTWPRRCLHCSLSIRACFTSTSPDKGSLLRLPAPRTCQGARLRSHWWPCRCCAAAFAVVIAIAAASAPVCVRHPELERRSLDVPVQLDLTRAWIARLNNSPRRSCETSRPPCARTRRSTPPH